VWCSRNYKYSWAQGRLVLLPFLIFLTYLTYLPSSRLTSEAEACWSASARQCNPLLNSREVTSHARVGLALPQFTCQRSDEVMMNPCAILSHARVTTSLEIIPYGGCLYLRRVTRLDILHNSISEPRSPWETALESPSLILGSWRLSTRAGLSYPAPRIPHINPPYFGNVCPVQEPW
jgi:hypothetical protein